MFVPMDAPHQGACSGGRGGVSGPVCSEQAVGKQAAINETAAHGAKWAARSLAGRGRDHFQAPWRSTDDKTIWRLEEFHHR